MTLYETLRSDIVTAIKSKNKEIVPQLRSLDAAITKVAKDTGAELTDDLFLTVTKKSIKELENARTFAVKAGREDLVEQNKREVALLSKYVPNTLSVEETEEVVIIALDSTGVTSKKEMGRVMGYLKKNYGAKLDMGLTSRIVGEKLS